MTFQQFTDNMLVPDDDFYVTYKMKEEGHEILSNFDEDPGDSPLIGLLAQTIFSLEGQLITLRKYVIDLERRLDTAGVPLSPSDLVHGGPTDG